MFVDGYVIPNHWMSRQGEIGAAMEAYLAGEDYSVRVVREYLTEWIAGEDLTGADVASLRASVGEIRTKQEVQGWIGKATAAGMCPL